MSDLMRSARYASESPGLRAGTASSIPASPQMPKNYGVTVERVGNGFVVGGHPYNQREDLVLATTIDAALEIARKKLSEI